MILPRSQYELDSAQVSLWVLRAGDCIGETSVSRSLGHLVLLR
jgi:hypothetical protein